MNTTNRRNLLAAALIGAAFTNTLAYAQAQPADDKAAAAAPKASAGILPLPYYSGDLATREYLTGDWGGFRNDLANHGLTLSPEWTQWAQGVVSGGKDTGWEYGGAFDIPGSFDLMRLGLVPGGLVQFRMDSRYGKTVNSDTGTLLPVNTAGSVPITGSTDESIAALTQLNYAQFLGEQFAVTFGKVQTYDGDANEFASGRGNRQFMNFNFVFNSVYARTVPYSTLAAGIIVMPTKAITITSTVMNTADSSTTSGFNDIDKGTTWATEAYFQYKLGKLPGGMCLGGTYAFNNDFAELNGQFQIQPGAGIVLPRKSDSWCVYWNGWQYLYSPDEAPAKIDLGNGKPDMRGFGLFARLGYADKDTSPVEWSASGGLGGRGLIPGRDNDTWGVGYNYDSLTDTRLGSVLNLRTYGQGFEAFYDLAITRAVDLTFDVQWVESARASIAAATVLAARLDVRF